MFTLIVFKRSGLFKRIRKLKWRSLIISIAVLFFTVSINTGTVARPPECPTLVCALDRIQTEIESGNLAGARRDLDALESDNLSPVAGASLKAVRGNLLFENGDYSGAIDSYKRALPVLEGVDRDLVTLALAEAYLYRSRYPGPTADDRPTARHYLLSLLDSTNVSVAVGSRLTLLEIDPDDNTLVGETLRRVLELPPGDERASALARLAPLSPSPPDTFDAALDPSAGKRARLAVFLERSRWEIDNGRPSEALRHSESAARLADAIPAPGAILTARTLIARSYLRLGSRGRAERSYALAMDSVARLRRIYAGNPVPATVLDGIDSAVRGYLQLTLDSPSPDLERAARLIRLSGRIEIDRYFRSVCPSPDRASSAPPNVPTATILTAALPNAFHSIATLPDGTYLHSREPETAEEIGRLAGEWRSALSDPFYNRDRTSGERFYRLIVRSFEERLKGIDRLVFVNDAALLNVPMAALYDGSGYLISRFQVLYSVGDAPGASASSPPEPALLVAAYPSKGLPGTSEEIENLKLLLGSSEAIAPDAVKDLPRLLSGSKYRLLHIATHSVFGEGAGGAYLTVGRETLSPVEFQALLRARGSDLSHLTLSSCESATGDKYATLGLSGIALRSGLRSVTGSLWTANDLVTVDIMTRFYRAWRESGDPALALSLAQRQMIATRVNHPAYWANFILLVS
jgi:CHAT domain-containing protein/tetratricopeptide (TPR) repeat protein